MTYRNSATAMFTACLFLLGAQLAQAHANQAAAVTGADNLPQPDKDFVQAATKSSSTEIDAAKLALTRGPTRMSSRSPAT
jgi:predicted outer membrane protein